MKSRSQSFSWRALNEVARWAPVCIAVNQNAAHRLACGPSDGHSVYSDPSGAASGRAELDAIRSSTSVCDVTMAYDGAAYGRPHAYGRHR